MPLGFTEAQALDLIKPDYIGRVGYAPFTLSNHNANMRRVKERIAELEHAATRQHKEEQAEGYTYREDPEENRVMFIFDGKPAENVRQLLKSHGFKWSPTRWRMGSPDNRQCLVCGKMRQARTGGTFRLIDSIKTRAVRHTPGGLKIFAACARRSHHAERKPHRRQGRREVQNRKNLNISGKIPRASRHLDMNYS